MALASTIVWEVRSGGSANNGGGFKTGASGTDYSQQNAAQYALTGVTTAAADAILLSASAAADMVGNVARIISGTNFTAGYYEIISVVVGVSITLDRNATSAAGAAGVVNIGGAVNSIGALGSATAGLGAQAGALICVKKDAAYTIAASDVLNFDGTSTLPIRIVGYNSTRPTATTHGDSYLGRTNGNGPLITTNMPAFNYDAGFRLYFGGSWILLEGLNITTAVASSALELSNETTVHGCVITNSSTNSSARIALVQNRCQLYNCDAGCTAASGTPQGVVLSSGTPRIIACRIRGGLASCIHVDTSTTGTIIQSTLYEGAVGIQFGGATTQCVVINNTITANTGDGIDIPASTYLQFIHGNMITDNGGYGIDMNSAAVGVCLGSNRTRDNVSGAINLGTGWIDATNFNAITTDTGGAATDYTDATTDDYSLISTSPAAYASIPLYSSMGALQRPSGGGSSVIVVEED